MTRDEKDSKSMLKPTAEPGDFKEGQKVALIIKARTDLGYKVIVDGTHWGLLYGNEVFRDLDANEITHGYVKKIREDGRLDISLQALGYDGIAAMADELMAKLESANGFLDVTDKTDPEEIYRRFGVSKKKWKMAVSRLYKERKIRIEPDGIKLIRQGRILRPK